MNKYYKYFFLYILPLLAIVIVIAQYAIPEPHFEDDKELLNFAETKQDKKKACQSFIKLLGKDSTNSRYQFLLAREWHKIRIKERSQFNFKLKKLELAPIQVYDRQISSEQPKLKDVGYFGKACMFYFAEDPYIAEKQLDSIVDKNHIGYSLLKGLIAEKRGYYQDAFSFFLKERKNKLFQLEVDLKLFQYLYNGEEFDRAKILLNGSIFKTQMSSRQERLIYYKTGEALNYLLVLPQRILKKIDLFGFLAALLVMLIWMLYLDKLNKLSETNKLFFLMAISGMFMIYPTLILYDFMNIEWGFQITQNIGNDLAFCIFGIGFIEELCKLMPLLLITLIRPSLLKKPMDFIIVGCASALGYSFIENLIYFTSNQLDIISSRAMISVVVHIAGTGIASYGVVILVWSEKRGKILKAMGYFFTAMVMHGVFDFWLINNIVNHFYYLSYLILVIEIFIWVKILNYCLNNSGAYENKELINVDRLNFILLVLLSSVICIEFLAYVFRHGTDDSFPVLKNAIIQGVFLIPYLSYRLSRIDLAPPGKKNVEIIEKNKAHNLDKILNRKAVLKAYSSISSSKKILPTHGIVLDRVSISGDNNWFEFKPDVELVLNGKRIQALFIKLKDKNQKLNSKNVIVHLRVQFEGVEKDKLSKLPFLDWGVLNIHS